MNVLVVQPGKSPKEMVIDGSLKSMQHIVGGLIEPAYTRDDSVVFVCNDEGIINGMPFNREIEKGQFIFGPFFICGNGEEEFASLTEEQMDKYKKRFASPEILVSIAGEYVSLPVKPIDHKKKDQNRGAR